jgi:hypothetical protein
MKASNVFGDIHPSQFEEIEKVNNDGIDFDSEFKSMDDFMTMIPPKIKKLPNLHKPQSGYIRTPEKGQTNGNRSLYMGGAKLVR